MSWILFSNLLQFQTYTSQYHITLSIVNVSVIYTQKKSNVYQTFEKINWWRYTFKHLKNIFYFLQSPIYKSKYIYIISIYIIKTMCPPQLSKKQLCDVHNVPKCMSCHEVILVITRKAHSSNDCMYIRLVLLVWDFSNLWVVDHFRPFISYIKQNESSKMHWNLMNHKEFGFLKILKLKCRMGHQIIQTFCKIGSPQKLDPPSLICTNLKSLRELLLNHAKFIEI